MEKLYLVLFRLSDALGCNAFSGVRVWCVTDFKWISLCVCVCISGASARVIISDVRIASRRFSPKLDVFLIRSVYREN